MAGLKGRSENGQEESIRPDYRKGVFEALQKGGDYRLVPPEEISREELIAYSRRQE